MEPTRTRPTPEVKPDSGLTARMFASPEEETALPTSQSGAPPLPRPGTVLGKYRLIEPKGKGASCVVYKAEHVKLPITVAIKIPRLAEIENTAALRDQLRTEAALLAHLNHPNIIRLWDYDDDPYPYLVVEYVQGYTFGQVMRGHKRLPPSWVLQMTYHLVKGLAAAHKLGIIHRDLKPENILVTDDGLVKVADLGLGAVIGNRLLRGVTSISSQGLVTGTAAYVAPEQARNADTCDHRADIYSLGATCYHAIAGQLPFQGKSVMEVILKHMNEPPRPLTQVVPGVKPAISDLIQRMLSKRAQERHQSYEELSAHLRYALNA